MLVLKQAEYQGDYFGFVLKKGYWYGVDEETETPIAASGWMCNDMIAIYYYKDNKWQKKWVDDDCNLNVDLSTIKVNLSDKLGFVDWYRIELDMESYEIDELNTEEYDSLMCQFKQYLFGDYPDFVLDRLYVNHKKEIK